MSGISSLSKFIKNPVPLETDLPIGVDAQGAIRVVLADLSVWVYNGSTAWTRSGGGGGGVTVDNDTIYFNGANNLAIKPKGITDGLIADPSSIIRNWDATIPYVIGQIVISSNGMWLCRVAGTNLTPSTLTNNWRLLANVDNANGRTFVQSVTTNYTWAKGPQAVRVTMSTTDVIVTMNTLSSFSDADSSNRIQQFLLMKDGSAMTLTLRLSGTDTFTDGTNSRSVVAGGSMIRFYADFGISKWRIG